MTVDLAVATDFKATFRRYPTGVALVTALTPEGPVGLTVSSLASVAAEPPVLSFSVSTATGSAQGVLAAESVTVHVLPADRADLATAFATSGAPRFTDEQGWSWRDGLPHLADAVAELGGTLRETVPVGSATLVLLDVDHLSLGPDVAPLLHLDRRYRVVG